jgi:hypothetical protein
MIAEPSVERERAITPFFFAKVQRARRVNATVRQYNNYHLPNPTMNKHSIAILAAALVAAPIFAQSEHAKQQPDPTGRIKLARQYCEKALAEARVIQDGDKRDWVLQEIGAAQADSGDITGALRTAESIGKADRKRITMYAIAGAQAKAGDLSSALKTAEALAQADGSKEPKESFALLRIVKALVASGSIDTALQTADEIHNNRAKSYALATIVRALAKAGKAADALRTISEKISDPKSKTMALRIVAAEQAKAGDTKGAESTVSLMPTNEDKAKGYLEFVSELLGNGPILRQE